MKLLLGFALILSSTLASADPSREQACQSFKNIQAGMVKNPVDQAAILAVGLVIRPAAGTRYNQVLIREARKIAAEKREKLDSIIAGVLEKELNRPFINLATLKKRDSMNGIWSAKTAQIAHIPKVSPEASRKYLLESARNILHPESPQWSAGVVEELVAANTVGNVDFEMKESLKDFYTGVRKALIHEGLNEKQIETILVEMRGISSEELEAIFKSSFFEVKEGASFSRSLAKGLAERSISYTVLNSEPFKKEWVSLAAAAVGKTSEVFKLQLKDSAEGICRRVLGKSADFFLGSVGKLTGGALAWELASDYFIDPKEAEAATLAGAYDQDLGKFLHLPAVDACRFLKQNHPEDPAAFDHVRQKVMHLSWALDSDNVTKTRVKAPVKMIEEGAYCPVPELSQDSDKRDPLGVTRGVTRDSNRGAVPNTLSLGL